MARPHPVLVVDDEPDIAGLLVALLESEGYRTMVAASGGEALALIAQMKPAAVVLDLSLPDFDGCDVLRQIKASRASAAIPVIVVSAYTGRLSDRDKALSHAVFEKPFNLDALLDAIGPLYEQARKSAVRAVVEHGGAVPEVIPIPAKPAAGCLYPAGTQAQA